MKISNLLTACVIATSLFLSGCSDDAMSTSGTDGVTVMLKLGVSAGPGATSRADGDNYDMGLTGERKVNDAMLIVYDRPINYDGNDGKVVKVFYLPSPLKFDPSSDKTSPSYFEPVPSFYPQTDVLNRVTVGTTNLSDACEKTFKVDDDVLETGKRYYAVALCNFGDMTSTFEGMSLKQFRDFIYTGALYDTAGSIKEYTNFRMTGINEESFIWERRTDGTLNLGQYLVQRLAARIDVALGEAGTEFVNPGSYTTDEYIRLAVYTQKEGSTETEILLESDGSPKYNFYLTDLKIVNAVDMGSTGTYLIERSSPHSPSYLDENNQPAVPVYLDNEGWVGKFSEGVRQASKYIFCPKNKSYRDIYSLAAQAGFSNVSSLMSSGAFIYDSNISDAKKNSSLVGYLPENTCSENHYTVLRVEGYTNASTSDIFAGSRGLDTSGLTKVVGDIPIMHNTAASSHVMDYAVVRNTIYRLRIKIVANDNKIYFRYYYVEAGATNQKEYTAAAFRAEVSDNNQDNPTIND